MAKKKKETPKVSLKLEAFIEIWGEVRECTILLYESGGFGIWISNDLYDGVSEMDEFLEQCQDVAYPSLEEYRDRVNGILISDWIKETGWIEKKED